jgi:hypothetical protein
MRGATKILREGAVFGGFRVIIGGTEGGRSVPPGAGLLWITAQKSADRMTFIRRNQEQRCNSRVAYAAGKISSASNVRAAGMQNQTGFVDRRPDAESDDG